MVLRISLTRKPRFSPMTDDDTAAYLSQAKHAVRVAVDEEGVTAAAYSDDMVRALPPGGRG